MGGDPCKDIGKLQHYDAHVHQLACVFSYLFFPAVVSLHVGEYINGGFCFMKATTLTLIKSTVTVRLYFVVFNRYTIFIHCVVNLSITEQSMSLSTHKKRHVSGQEEFLL